MRLVEKPRDWPADARWANGGIYLLGPRIWDFAPTSGYHDFGFDLLPADAGGGQPPPRLPLPRRAGRHRVARAPRRTPRELVERGRLPRPQVVLPC